MRTSLSLWPSLTGQWYFPLFPRTFTLYAASCVHGKCTSYNYVGGWSRRTLHSGVARNVELVGHYRGTLPKAAYRGA